MIALDLCLLHSQNLLITEIYKKQCKGCEQKRKIKSVRNFIGLKNNELNYKCKKCKEKKKWLEAINGLIKKFPNIYQFCNGGINKFVSLVRNKSIEIYELDPAHFLSAPELAWQACRIRVKLELLIDIDMFLMVEKGIRSGICHAIHRYVSAL